MVKLFLFFISDNKNNDKPWSLLDVNYKKIARGLKLPLQYNRSGDQLSNTFYNSERDNYYAFCKILYSQDKPNFIDVSVSSQPKNDNGSMKPHKSSNTKKTDINYKDSYSVNESLNYVNNNFNSYSHNHDDKTAIDYNNNYKCKKDENKKHTIDNYNSSYKVSLKEKESKNINIPHDEEEDCVSISSNIDNQIDVNDNITEKKFSQTHVNFKKINNIGLENFKNNKIQNIEKNSKNNKSNNNFDKFINKKNSVVTKIKENEANMAMENIIMNVSNQERENLLKNMEQSARNYDKAIKEACLENIKKIPNPFLKSKETNKKMTESDIFFIQKDHVFNNKHNDFPSSSNNNCDYNEKNNCNINNIPNIINNKKNKSENNNNNYENSKFPVPVPNNYKYRDSDIFNLKNNEVAINKLGEKYLMRKNFNTAKKYSTSSKSNSEWMPNENVKSIINHESVNYDILNCVRKKTLPTKSQIYNSYCVGANAQKGLSEIVDLTRVGVPNTNQEYLKAFNADNRLFMKQKDICDSFNDLYKEYKNLCEKPFVKKLF